jgi:hypothetical protein
VLRSPHGSGGAAGGVAANDKTNKTNANNNSSIVLVPRIIPCEAKVVSKRVKAVAILKSCARNAHIRIVNFAKSRPGNRIRILFCRMAALAFYDSFTGMCSLFYTILLCVVYV